MPSSKHSPLPWTAYNMTMAGEDRRMTPAEVGEYVKNSLLKGHVHSDGTVDFLFVSCDKPDGPSDVCHIGNGPDGPANAELITSAASTRDALDLSVQALNEAADLITTAYGENQPTGADGSFWKLYRAAITAATGEEKSDE